MASCLDKAFNGTCFDSEAMALIKDAFDAAWHEVCSTNAPFSTVRTSIIRDRLAHTILGLAEKGELNPIVLRRRALMSLRASEKLS